MEELIAIDRDPRAIAAGEALAKQDKRFSLYHATLSELGSVLKRATGSSSKAVDGVLADLGVSSPQLDEQDRGFSFRFDGPLDMRMDTTRGETVEEWLDRAEEREIGEVIWRYGEERFARQIARAVIAARVIGRIRTTRELAELVGKTVRTREPGQHPATRTFQALRIFINQELEEIEQVLPQAVEGLRTGGRLVVIAFHSLEDRIVKRFYAKRGEGGPPSLEIADPRQRGQRRHPANPRQTRQAIGCRSRRQPARAQRHHANGGDPVTRLNTLLLLVLIGCALSVVTSQHKARKLFIELQTEQDAERRLDNEWRELQIEAQTQGNGKRIEQKAARDLGMSVPDPKKTVIVVVDGAAPVATPAGAAK